MNELYRITTDQIPNVIYSFRDYDVRFLNGVAENVAPEVAYHITRTVNYYRVNGPTVPYNPDSWRKDRRVVWSCNYGSANGYGMVAENVVKSLLNKGANVLNPRGIAGDMTAGGEYVDSRVMETLNKVITPDCIEIQHCQPPQIATGVLQRMWTYTMFETDHTPHKWINIMNRTAEVVIVPSSWLVESWKSQGLTKPIEVYHHGVDPNYYHYIDRPERDKFTFLHYGQLGLRKGTDVLVQAFEDEFGHQDGVRLILKHSLPVWPVHLGIPNVEYINATYSKERMMGLLAEADCLVFPTRGEGFGLPPLEAMATGLPVIVTNWSGPVDYVNKEDTLTIDYEMQRSYGFDRLYQGEFELGENSGCWAEPSYEDLRFKMRWAFEHRKELKEMGKKASDRILTDWTWDKKTDQLIKILDKYA